MVGVLRTRQIKLIGDVVDKIDDVLAWDDAYLAVDGKEAWCFLAALGNIIAAHAETPDLSAIITSKRLLKEDDTGYFDGCCEDEIEELLNKYGDMMLTSQRMPEAAFVGSHLRDYEKSGFLKGFVCFCDALYKYNYQDNNEVLRNCLLNDVLAICLDYAIDISVLVYGDEKNERLIRRTLEIAKEIVMTLRPLEKVHDVEHCTIAMVEAMILDTAALCNAKQWRLRACATAMVALRSMYMPTKADISIDQRAKRYCKQFSSAQNGYEWIKAHCRGVAKYAYWLEEPLVAFLDDVRLDDKPEGFDDVILPSVAETLTAFKLELLMVLDKGFSKSINKLEEKTQRLRQGHSTKKKKHRRAFIAIVLAILAVISVAVFLVVNNAPGWFREAVSERPDTKSAAYISDMPQGSAECTIINNGIPSFGSSIFPASEFCTYSEVDDLTRCRGVMACIGKESLNGPKKTVYITPSGWVGEESEVLYGEGIYEKCMLIGSVLGGTSVVSENVISATQTLKKNIESYEQRIRKHVTLTGNHVLYRVRPLYDGKNALATGVQLEAYSIEDRGELSVNVLLKNVQEGHYINYRTGEWRINKDGYRILLGRQLLPDNQKSKYIINRNTEKYHYSWCAAVYDMASWNKMRYSGEKKLIELCGYVPCQRCRP